MHRVRQVACHATETGSSPVRGANLYRIVMIKQALLVDIWEAPRDVKDSFLDFTEVNGNPFYHRWRISETDLRYSEDTKKVKVNNWLKSQGLTEKDIIIITGGW